MSRFFYYSGRVVVVGSCGRFINSCCRVIESGRRFINWGCHFIGSCRRFIASYRSVIGTDKSITNVTASIKSATDQLHTRLKSFNEVHQLASASFQILISVALDVSLDYLLVTDICSILKNFTTSCTYILRKYFAVHILTGT